MKNEPIMPAEDSSHGTLMTYVTGFVLSIVLTMTAYLLVVHHTFGGSALIGAILGLAVVQLFVQMVFFLHLGRGSSRRWNLTVFTFMLIVLGILVLGSLWIMHNLNYHMTMSPQSTDTFIRQDEGIYNP